MILRCGREKFFIALDIKSNDDADDRGKFDKLAEIKSAGGRYLARGKCPSLNQF